MSSHDRRAAGRRRAWGRRPIILKLEPLERREMLTASASAASSTLPDLVNSALVTTASVSDWGGTLEVEGRVKNQGGSTTTAPFQIEIYVDSIRGSTSTPSPSEWLRSRRVWLPGSPFPYDTSVRCLRRRSPT